MSGFMVMGLVSWWSLTNHSNSVFTDGAHLAQPRWMPVRGILGGGQTCGVSFRPFLNSSGWWWLISSIFLIRKLCILKSTYWMHSLGREVNNIIFPQFLVFAFSHQTQMDIGNMTTVWNPLLNSYGCDAIWGCQAPRNPQPLSLEMGSAWLRGALE